MRYSGSEAAVIAGARAAVDQCAHTAGQIDRLFSRVRFFATLCSVFGALALLLLAVATVACLLPARRAAKIDPMVALRSE